LLNKSLHISFNAALLITQPSLLHDDYGYEFSVFIGIDEFFICPSPDGIRHDSFHRLARA